MSTTKTAIEKPERTTADIRLELFEGVNQEFSDFLSSIAEQDAMTPEQVDEVSKSLAGTVAKRDSLAKLIFALEESATVLREREKRIAVRRQEFEKIANLVRSSVLVCLQNNPAGIVKRVDGLENSFRVHANPPKVEITSEEDLPGQYITYIPQPDKNKIKEALKGGEEVPGARIADTTYRLEIK